MITDVGLVDAARWIASAIEKLAASHSKLADAIAAQNKGDADV